jgi:hypothetical protein
MQHRARERLCSMPLNAIQQMETLFSELADNLVDIAIIVACFMRFAVRQIGCGQLS